jgi:chromosome partitioning protein
MTHVIAVANQKGGVGKTTTVVSLAAALAERDRRVLSIDLDPQGSLTLALGLNPDSCNHTIWDAMMVVGGNNLHSIRESPISAVNAGFDVVPANSRLEEADQALLPDPHGMFRLRDALPALVDRYDYVLIDCPPTLGILAGNALVAATRVLIPLQADYLALRGVDRLIRAIDLVRAHHNPELEIAGLLFTLADGRLLHTQEIMQAARATFGSRVPIFTESVRPSVRLKEAPVVGQSILQYAPHSSAAEAYRSLARELEEGVPIPPNHPHE